MLSLILRVNAQVCFTPSSASPFAVGSAPRSVTSADFNADGNADLAVTNGATNTVAVLLGNGAGNFALAVNFVVGIGPLSVTSADFNNDGKTDLAVAVGGNNTLSVLLGNGAGGFAPAVTFAVGAQPRSITSADFNADGNADLATANYNSNNISVLLGNGTGSFGAAVNFAVGTNPFSVTNADFNADGKADLAVANSNSNNVSILFGNGAGSFASAVNFAVGTNPRLVISADFNADGKADLATANIITNNVSVLLGNGAGSFVPAVNFAVGSGPESVTSADFNADGKTDLATANVTSNDVSVLLGNGAGSFVPSANCGVGTGPRSIISADFNTDGKADLVTANWGSDNVSVLLNVPPPSVSVNASVNVVCAGTSVTLFGSGATTYTCMPGNLIGSSVSVNPTSTTVYTVTGSNGSCCSSTATIQIVVSDACSCQICNPIGTSGTVNTSPASNQSYCINNNITINGPVTFANSEFKVGSNITITVANGAILTINNSHLYAGTNMWSGIIIQNGGQLNIVNNSLIEDAITGVSIINHTTLTNILTVDASIFNRNANSIKIQGYNQNISPYPFIITNSLFTCRKIADCSTIGVWPSTTTVKGANNPTSSPLETPYINNANYPVVNLKAPYANNKSFRGILLNNVGTSNVTTSSSSYNEITIGTITGTNSYNVFDNQWYGIDALNSNVSVVNSIFQNGYNLSFPSLYSVGIKAIAATNYNCRLQVNTSSYINNNKFYDLTRAVFTQYLHDLNVNYCEMFSTRVFNSSSATKFGAYGVSAMSSHYNTVNLNYNKIFNIDNGLVFNAVISAYTVGSASGNGQYLGSIYANNNIIRSHVTAPNPSIHYGFKAISLSSILGAANVTPANQVVNTTSNIIYDYENGIFCSNFPLHHVTSLSNDVFMRNTATSLQYGIEHDNNSNGSSIAAQFTSHGIHQNIVSANSISTNPNNYAIRSSQNTASAVRCNTVSNTYKGIAYDGTAIQGSYFFYNDFLGNNRYGFVLENTGVIGQQGAVDLGPTDNRWLGSSWVSPNFKTATLNSTAANSKLYIRLTSTVFNPNGSGFTFPGAYGVTDYFYSGTTGTLRQGNFASYAGCNFAKPADSTGIILLEQIAKNQAPNGIEHAIARFVAKSQLFNFLKTNPDFLNKSGILNGFYNSNKNKYRDIFAQIEEDIVLGNTNQAQNELTAFTPQNNSETKHKEFFTLLLKHQAQTLDVADEQPLLDLANGCPATDGNFIHKARTLYNVAFDKNINFTNNCGISANARQGNFIEEQTEETFVENIMLYPNPASTGEVYVLISDPNVEMLEVEVNNVNGMSVLKQTLSIQNYIGKLNLIAADGIYMVIITNKQTNKRVIKKLVIQK